MFLSHFSIDDQNMTEADEEEEEEEEEEDRDSVDGAMTGLRSGKRTNNELRDVSTIHLTHLIDPFR
ncbi:MAG: hypothetical protein VXW31_04830 [Planctomycetota bacterium]|nr:hypothetical protein [Planctomycetota bacterium]